MRGQRQAKSGKPRSAAYGTTALRGSAIRRVLVELPNNLQKQGTGSSFKRGRKCRMMEEMIDCLSEEVRRDLIWEKKAKPLGRCDSGRRTCFHFYLGPTSIYIFPQALALSATIATPAKLKCHTLRDHTGLDGFQHRTAVNSGCKQLMIVKLSRWLHQRKGAVELAKPHWDGHVTQQQQSKGPCQILSSHRNRTACGL
jgi:hypothetical protein